MVNPVRNFYKDGFYHIFNRGSEKRLIFEDDYDRGHFIKTLAYYQQVGVDPRLSIRNFKIKDRQPPYLFEIVAFCLMPNHFHLLLKENGDNISIGIGRILNSYARYYNTRHQRIGPLFQGRFKSVEVQSNEQLLHVSRYIMLNPVTGKMVDDPSDYPWSSYNDYLNKGQYQICSNKEVVLQQFASESAFTDFHHDYIDYSRSLSEIKKLALEEI